MRQNEKPIMNKPFFILALVAFAVACTPKAKKAVEGPAPAAPSASNAPTEAQLTAAKTKFPAATMDELQKGHSIYYGACTRCHGAEPITKYDEKQWVGILDEMAGKAQLSAAEKDATWKYIMGVKLASK